MAGSSPGASAPCGSGEDGETTQRSHSSLAPAIVSPDDRQRRRPRDGELSPAPKRRRRRLFGSDDGDDDNNGASSEEEKEEEEEEEEEERVRGSSNRVTQDVEADEDGEEEESVAFHDKDEEPTNQQLETGDEANSSSSSSSSAVEDSDDEMEEDKEEEDNNETSIVIHQRLTPGWCQKRCQDNHCRCVIARMEQNCQACHSPIDTGHCIVNQGYGWVHVRCEGDENRDNCGNLYTCFIPLSLPALLTLQAESRLQLEGQGTAQDAAGSSYSSSSADSIIPVLEDFEREQQDEAFGLTEEQKAVVGHRASSGDLIRVIARAGTGKTTTVSFLCHELLTQDSSHTILYVVFGRAVMKDAKQSGKFPKETAIFTSHALALRGLGIPFSKVTNGYNRALIIDLLDLKGYVMEVFPSLSRKDQKKRCTAIAGYVIKTLQQFQNSSDKTLLGNHVYWKSRVDTVRSKWRSTISVEQYVRWAETVFDEVKRVCSAGDAMTGSHLKEVPHDGYLKVFQLEILNGERTLENSRGDPYSVIIVDEAQDLTPCQASILWGACAKGTSAVYIVGDDRQRLYRFRGVSNSFETTTPTKTFPLTGSFRFGENIARVANLVLGHDRSRRDYVRGLAETPGQVTTAAEFSSGVVICRTNNGVYHCLQKLRPRRWTFVSGSSNWSPRQSARDLKCLRDFYTGVARAYKTDNEIFTSVADLEEYCEEADKSDTLNKIELVKYYLDENVDIESLFSELCRTYVRDWREEGLKSIDEFDGIALTTCHGAKGLEFNNVLVWDDFRFDELKKIGMESFLSKPHFREMTDLIYVAVTRTRKHLFLRDAAQEYFQWLESNLPEEDSRMGGVLGVASDDHALSDLRSEMETQWQTFENSSTPINSVDCVPWPLGPDDNPFCLHSNMSREEQGRVIRLAFLRYHPDKFYPMFRGRIALASWDEVKKLLNRLVEQAKEIKDHLRPSDRQ